MARYSVRAWLPKSGFKEFQLNAPDIKTAMNVAKARVPKAGEVQVQPARRKT